MNNIEDDLKRALRRQEPPADFAAKIMNRVVSGENLEPEPHLVPNKVLGFRLKPRVMVWLATAAAAACLLGLFVTRSYQSDRPRAPISDSGQASAPRSERGTALTQPDSKQTTAADATKDDSISRPVAAESHGGRRHIHHLRWDPNHKGTSSQPSEEARRAEEQLKLALAIASAKLGYAQRSIQEADGTNTLDRGINP